jgi:hypothetical protein
VHDVVQGLVRGCRECASENKRRMINANHMTRYLTLSEDVKVKFPELEDVQVYSKNRRLFVKFTYQSVWFEYTLDTVMRWGKVIRYTG